MAGTINPAGDLDYFALAAAAGDRVWTSVDTGSPPAQVGGSRDSLFGLYATNGTTLIEFDDDDGTGNGGDGSVETTLASVIAGRGLASAGTYYLRVQGWNAAATIDPYRLYTVLTNAAQQSAESEPNGTAGTANPIIPSGQQVGVRTGTITTGPPDSDIFSFQANANDLIFIAADGDPERDSTSTNIDFQLRASDGTLLATANNSGTTPIFNGGFVGEGLAYNITATGTYGVRVSGATGGTAGTYHVMVANCTSVFAVSADLSITKTDGQATAVPGQNVTYTITASNAGPGNATGATVVDTFPAALSGVTWTCVGAGGATCTAAGSGNINDTVNLPAGGSVTFTASGTLSSSATGTLSNTATVSAPSGVTDPNLANNSATDTDTLTPQADLSISKDDGLTSVIAGSSVTYNIVVSNPGPSDALGATVADTFPAVLSGVTWTCVGAGGATCPASGSGDINATVDLPAGGSVTFTVSATVRPNASGVLSNTATVTPPTSVTDPDLANNSATDITTIIPRGRIVIRKRTVPPSDPLVFSFTLTGGPSALNQSFTLGHGQNHNSGLIVPGSGYVAAEIVPPVDWLPPTATCNDGSPVSNIDVSPGETVICTFVNTRAVIAAPDPYKLNMGGVHSLYVLQNDQPPGGGLTIYDVTTPTMPGATVVNNMTYLTYTALLMPYCDYLYYRSTDGVNVSNWALITLGVGTSPCASPPPPPAP